MNQITMTARAFENNDPVHHEVSAYEVAPGLGVHRHPYFNYWVVAHIKSGYKIASPFPSRKAAVEFAERVRGLTDWTQPADKIGSNMGLHDAVQKEKA